MHRHTGRIASQALAFLLALSAGSAQATSIEYRALDEIVLDADHVLSGRIVRVDMVDPLGRQVHDRNARTGPGLTNTIRFLVEVDEVLFTTCKRPPRRVLVPLWRAWHYTLGTMQDQLTGSSGLFLLKGADFQPAYPQDFQRSPGERPLVEAGVDALRLEREPASMSCREAPAQGASTR